MRKGKSTILPLLLKCHNFLTLSSRIDVFFFTSAIQCRNMWNGIKHLIEILLSLVALDVF